MLELKHVSKIYKGSTSGIKDISFKIGKGEIVGLLGRNGAGKTTLIKCISKALFVSQGEIVLHGDNIQHKDKALNRVGILTETVFYEHLTVMENIEFYLGIHNYLVNYEDIKEMLGFVHLKGKEKSKIQALSYGMKQKVALVLCLISNPELLILDEPFVGLDESGIEELQRILREWAKEKEVSIIISSHQFGELEEICSRYILLKEGQVVFDGLPSASNTVVFALDRAYEGRHRQVNTTEEAHVITTTAIGDQLNQLIGDLIKDYKILNITSKASGLKDLFEEGSMY